MATPRALSRVLVTRSMALVIPCPWSRPPIEGAARMSSTIPMASTTSVSTRVNEARAFGLDRKCFVRGDMVLGLTGVVLVLLKLELPRVEFLLEVVRRRERTGRRAEAIEVDRDAVVERDGQLG